MFESTRRVVGVLAGATTVTLTLGVGASTGLVPKLASAGSDSVEAASVTQAAPVEVVQEVVPETTLPPAPPPTAPPTTAAPRVTAPPTTRPAPKPAPTTVATEAPAGEAAAAAPALAPRRVPSAAEVQQVIAGISSRVRLPLFVQITPAHVADIGNQICTAFDQGQTFQQVKATGLAMVSQYVTVSDEAADYAVRQGVALYCPAYASKLV